MAFVIGLLSHRRPAWSDLVWLHREEHDGVLFGTASIKGVTLTLIRLEPVSWLLVPLQRGFCSKLRNLKRCCVVHQT